MAVATIYSDFEAQENKVCYCFHCFPIYLPWSDEMAGWYHGLDGHESEWTPGDGDGQGGLVYWDSWGRKESDTTEWLNWTELNWKEESEKAALKLNIQKMKIIASGPITSWQIEGRKVNTMTEFIFLGSKITMDGDRSHEIERWLLLEEKLGQT